MKVKVLFAFDDELEYRSVVIDHPLANQEVLSVFLGLKYRLFGLTVEPLTKGSDSDLYLRIPSTRQAMHGRILGLSTRQFDEVTSQIKHECIRLSARDQSCRGCGMDHDLMDLCELVINPDCIEPYDGLLLGMPLLRPRHPPPTWSGSGKFGPMVLN